MEQVQRPGMSKGCMIGLIVAAVLLVIIIIIGAIICAKKDELLKWGTKTSLNMAKSYLCQNAVAGVDSVKFNAVTDAFMARLESEPIDLAKYQPLGTVIQEAIKDQKVDSAEASHLLEAMIAYAPELDSLLRAPASSEMAAPVDTMASPADSSAGQ